MKLLILMLLLSGCATLSEPQDPDERETSACDYGHQPTCEAMPEGQDND